MDVTVQNDGDGGILNGVNVIPTVPTICASPPKSCTPNLLMENNPMGTSCYPDWSPTGRTEEAVTILRGLDSWKHSAWVFPSENPATCIDPRNFYTRVWVPAVKRAGIEWVTWHDLRHRSAVGWP